LQTQATAKTGGKNTATNGS